MDDQIIESSTEEDSSISHNVLLSARIRELEAAKDEDSAGKQSDLEREEDDSNDVSDNFDNFVNMKRVLDMIHIVLTDKEDGASGSSDVLEPPALPPSQEPPKIIEDSEEVNTSSSEDSGSTVKAWRILTDRVRRKRSGTAVPRKCRRTGGGVVQKRPAASRAPGTPALRRASRSTVASRAPAPAPAALDAVEDAEGGSGDLSSPSGCASPPPQPQLPPLPPLSTAGMLRRAAERGAAPPPGARPLAAARRPVACRVVGPVLAALEALPPHGLQPPAGVALLDVHFHMPTNVSEVVFRNHYTASVSVLVRAVHYTSAAKAAAARASSPRGAATDPAGDAGADAKRSSGSGEEWPWEMSIPCRVLMEDPHFETDAQDYFSLLFTESVVPWRNLLSMRLVLRQPSPCWPHHTVRDVTVYSEPPPVSLRIAARRLFASDCDMQEHNEAWKTVQLNTINSMTPSVYRPRTAPGSQVLPDYEIDTL